MNYSREWQEHLDYYNSLTQRYDWDYVAREQNLTDPKNDKAENLIILNKPVWVEIHDMVGDRPFRKIKAISKYNAYFDGIYRGMSYSLSLGCHQEKLLNFIKEYSDGFYEPVPKGILKIPTII